MPKSLLEDQFAEPFLKWKATPTPATADGILGAVRPVLDAAVRTYGGDRPSPNMANHAKRIALDALPRYDPAQSGLKTFLVHHLKGLHRYRAKEQQLLATPERILIDQRHLFESEQALRDRLGRDPSGVELADATGLSTRRINRIRQAHAGMTEGALNSQEDSEEGGRSPAVESTYDTARAWQEFVYHGLPPTDQLILEHVLGLHGKTVLSNRDLANKLRVSESAVSQRKVKIQQMLDAREETGVF